VISGAFVGKNENESEGDQSHGIGLMGECRTGSHVGRRG
jgi:hypothetical protein